MKLNHLIRHDKFQNEIWSYIEASSRKLTQGITKRKGQQREAKRGWSSDSPLPAGDGADPCILCSLWRQMEVGISFLCVWRVDRVSLGHGGVDLVKESPSIWKNKFAASPSLADLASSGMWAACFSHQSWIGRWLGPLVVCIILYHLHSLLRSYRKLSWFLRNMFGNHSF